MILSDRDIIRLLEERRLQIEPKPKNIHCAHVNLNLSDKLRRYKGDVLDLRNEAVESYEFLINSWGYRLKPNEFILGSTLERVSMPNGYMGFIETKGNIARAGIQIHNCDGHIDPGFSGNVTLEIKNNSGRSIIIYPEMPIAQLYIFQLSSDSLIPYNGKYQNQKGPTSYIADK